MFKDGSHILYFNTARQDDNVLGKLARDFKEANPKEMQSEVLSHRVASLKEGKLDREGEKKMNVLLEKYRKKAVEEGIEKGMEKGIEKGIEQGIQKGLEQGKNHLAIGLVDFWKQDGWMILREFLTMKITEKRLLKEFGLLKYLLINLVSKNISTVLCVEYRRFLH